MTVKELIANLRTFDGDAMVAIASYESGFSELCDIEQIDLVMNTRAMPNGSTHHRSNWSEAARKNNIVAICVGPLDPSKLGEVESEAEGLINDREDNLAEVIAQLVSNDCNTLRRTIFGGIRNVLSIVGENRLLLCSNLCAARGEMTEANMRDPAIRVVLLPRDTNRHGTIFGGIILSYIDLAGATEVAKTTRQRIVTVALKEVIFKAPVMVGEPVSFYTKTTKVGTSSVSVHVDVEVMRGHEVIKVTEADMTFVVVDEHGHATPIIHNLP